MIVMFYHGKGGLLCNQCVVGLPELRSLAEAAEIQPDKIRIDGPASDFKMSELRIKLPFDVAWASGRFMQDLQIAVNLYGKRPLQRFVTPYITVGGELSYQLNEEAVVTWWRHLDCPRTVPDNDPSLSDVLDPLDQIRRPINWSLFIGWFIAFCEAVVLFGRVNR